MPTGLIGSVVRNEEATGRIQCTREGLLEMFDSSFFTCFSKVFVVGSRKTCPGRFHEVDESSPRPIIRGQFGVDGDEDGRMISGQ